MVSETTIWIILGGTTLVIFGGAFAIMVALVSFGWNSRPGGIPLRDCRTGKIMIVKKTTIKPGKTIGEWQVEEMRGPYGLFPAVKHVITGDISWLTDETNARVSGVYPKKDYLEEITGEQALTRAELQRLQLQNVSLRAQVQKLMAKTQIEKYYELDETINRLVKAKELPPLKGGNKK